MRNKANLLRGHGRPLPRPPALTPGLPNAIHRVWGPLPPAGRLRGRLCKTNPISGGAGWDEAPGPWDTGQTCKTNPICRVGWGTGDRKVRNEPNFRPSGGPDGPGIRHRMPAPPHGSGHRTTRCLGHRHGVDSVWNTGFSRIEQDRLKAVLGSQTRFIAFGHPLRTADADDGIDL